MVLNETTTSKKSKRGERVEENTDVKVGDRVKAKFDDGDWYEGSVSSVKRGKVGEVVRVWIDYDDNSYEEVKWPDKDIVVIGSDMNGKKSKKKLRKRKVESRVDKAEVDGARLFYCGEGLCEYYSNRADSLKRHKANIHEIDVTYYLCGEDGCEYKAKDAGHVKSHKARIHGIILLL